MEDNQQSEPNDFGVIIRQIKDLWIKVLEHKLNTLMIETYPEKRIEHERKNLERRPLYIIDYKRSPVRHQVLDRKPQCLVRKIIH